MTEIMDERSEDTLFFLESCYSTKQGEEDEHNTVRVARNKM
jgi:hypothetical protein